MQFIYKGRIIMENKKLDKHSIRFNIIAILLKTTHYKEVNGFEKQRKNQ